MPLQVSHKLYPNYLEIHISGNRTEGKEIEETAAIVSKIFAISTETGHTHILIHAAIPEKLPLGSQIDISMNLEQIGITYEHRIALVAHNKEVFMSSQLIVGYLENKGYSVQLFRNREKGRKWLVPAKRRSAFLELLDSFKLF